MKIRPEIKRFSEEMEKVLQDNDHKGGWGKCSNEFLLNRIHDELNELTESLRDNHDCRSIIKECIDVANFCMMLAENIYSKENNGYNK